MMAQNLIASLSFLKSNILSCTRLTTHVRYFHPFQCPSHRLRYNKHSVSQLKLSCSKSRIACNFTRIRKTHSTVYEEVDTNIANNLLLWKYHNMKYFRNLKIIISIQTVVFLGVAYFMYSYLPSIDKYETYKQYVKENALLLTSVSMPVVITIFSVVLIYFVEAKSLKYIILNKGGKIATLVSFHPIKGSKSAVVPINNISVAKGRNGPGAYMTLKVKGTKLFYLLDKDGTFVNPQLFDFTVGALRT